MTAPQPHPTNDQMRAVFDAEKRYRPNWPASFDMAMADPLLCRLILMLTRHVYRPDPQQVARKSIQAGIQAGPDAREFAQAEVDPIPIPDTPRKPAIPTGKSQAAGERD